MENKSMGIAAILVLAAVLSVLAPALGAGAPQEMQKASLDVQFSISVPTPNTAYYLECKENRKKAYENICAGMSIMEKVDALELPGERMVLESLGTYYITGYTSVECGGSTTTASGTTCHKAASYGDSLWNPTTCAIDPALHDFGDTFYLEQFGYFIAEDTGSAVKGKHLDLYFWDSEYNYALSITGYYEVFLVTYEPYTYPASTYNVCKKVAQERVGLLTDSSL